MESQSSSQSQQSTAPEPPKQTVPQQQPMPSAQPQPPQSAASQPAAVPPQQTPQQSVAQPQPAQPQQPQPVQPQQTQPVASQTVQQPQTVQQVQLQPPPQHIQYNIDEETLRKFCQPYNMAELVKMITNTAFVNKQFYDILTTEIKKTGRWCKLFVHGLPWTTTQETLFATFARFGQIQECVILRDRNGQSKGYGFINYSNADDAMR